MNAEDRVRLIDRYREGHRQVAQALEGISEEELDGSTDGEWTPRQTAHHMGDGEIVSAIRLRLLLTEP